MKTIVRGVWTLPPRWRAVLLLFAAAGVLGIGAALVCPGDHCRPPAIDIAGLALAHGWRTATLDAGMAAATWLGSIYVLAPLALCLAWRQWTARRWRDASFIPAALLAAALSGHAAKMLVARPRPELFPAVVALPVDGSFPSGHAMQASALTLAWLLRPGRRPPRPAELALAAALLLLVGISRLYLQVHFPSDVIFGTVAAALLVLGLRSLPLWSGRRYRDVPRQRGGGGKARSPLAGGDRRPTADQATAASGRSG